MNPGTDVGRAVGYKTAAGLRVQALVKAFRTIVDNDPLLVNAAQTTPNIDLVYVDSTGTVQTINNVPHTSRVTPGVDTNVWFEAFVR